MRAFLHSAASRTASLIALRIALVVGSALNLVNLSEAVIAEAGVSWIHAPLEYTVPCCVATYSATENRKTRRWDT